MKIRSKDKFLILTVFVSTLVACSWQTKQKVNEKIPPATEEFTLVEHEMKMTFSDANKSIYTFTFEGFSETIFLVLDQQVQTSKMIIQDAETNTGFNFFYDMSEEDGLALIKVFVSKNSNLIFVLPVPTEEYASFEVLKFDQSSKKFTSGSFGIEMHDNAYESYQQFCREISIVEDSFRIRIDTMLFTGKLSTP